MNKTKTIFEINKVFINIFNIIWTSDLQLEGLQWMTDWLDECKLILSHVPFKQAYRGILFYIQTQLRPLLDQKYLNIHVSMLFDTLEAQISATTCKQILDEQLTRNLINKIRI